KGFFDIEEAKVYARQTGKPIFIDFTGINCNNCRKMEQYVLSNDDVKRYMNDNFVLCELYCDMNDIDLPESEWVKDGERTIKTLGRRNLFFQRTHYNMNAQPYYVIIDADGNQMTKENFSYNPDPAKFLDFLKEGAENYSKK
ncbi:MAG: thioredoxin family protein, partial [Bacteroidales bacterium]|nr:thioredoxin family protein [Bacteroidales bacterium]